MPGGTPPGVAATWIARGPVVQVGQRCQRRNRRALPRWSLLPLGPPTALLGIAGGPVARVGIAVALVGEVVAFIGSPLPLIEVVPGPVQGGDPLALSRLDDRRILSRG